MREIGDIIDLAARRAGEPLALATLVRAWGSSYRRPGARMLIALDGETAGSLSGGCLEEEVVERAREVLRSGEAARMEFDTRRRFGCHGGIEILVEKVRADFLAELAEHHQARRSAWVATDLDHGSRFLESSEGDFVQRIDPPIQLVVVGEGPDSTALRGLAQTLGWHVIEAATASELPGPFDAWTAAIVKTHNYGRDFASLRALLPWGLRYIGLLGPRRRREQLLGDLLDTGIAAPANLFAPAGLDLGGDSPEAIALAIVAEIQAVFSGSSGEPLRERREPIHAEAELAVVA